MKELIITNEKSFNKDQEYKSQDFVATLYPGRTVSLYVVGVILSVSETANATGLLAIKLESRREYRM